MEPVMRPAALAHWRSVRHQARDKRQRALGADHVVQEGPMVTASESVLHVVRHDDGALHEVEPARLLEGGRWHVPVPDQDPQRVQGGHHRGDVPELGDVRPDQAHGAEQVAAHDGEVLATAEHPLHRGQIAEGDARRPRLLLA
eukprot:7113116-Pyramimonas_sp.AAC.1